MKRIAFYLFCCLSAVLFVSCEGDPVNSDIRATVLLDDALNVNYASATISGHLIVDSSHSFSKSATLYYSSSEFTMNDLKASGNNKRLSLNPDGSFTLLLVGLSGGTTYNYAVVATVEGLSFETAIKAFSTTTTLPSGAIDMGLSVKWASSNVGAGRPEDFGDYYAWGETEPKSNYSWSTYKFATGSSGSLIKYNTSSSYGTVDNKTVLEPVDDVAHEKFGGKWRMPTAAEWTELRDEDNCDWTWTKQNGVKGKLVTSKKTGNSIFLPAGGFRSKDQFNGAGYYGFCWSSSIAANSPDVAWYVHFYTDDAFYPSGVICENGYRYRGHPVRPVCEY